MGLDKGGLDNVEYGTFSSTKPSVCRTLILFANDDLM